MRQYTAIVLSILFVIGAPIITQAQDAQNNLLQGAVKGTALHPNTGIDHIGISIKSIQQTSLAISQESMRPNQVNVRSPNIVGSTTVIQPFPGPSGTFQLGYLEPRKKQVTDFLQQVKDNNEMLSKQISALIVSPEKQAQVGPIISQINSIIANNQTDIGLIEAQLKESKLDNMQIAKPSLQIYNASFKLEKLRMELKSALN
jgi:hypothetical protein